LVRNIKELKSGRNGSWASTLVP